MVSQYIRHFLQSEPISGIEWEYQTAKNLFDEIKLEEVSSRINDYVHPENMVVVVQQKEEEGEDIFDDESVLEIMKEVENAQVTAYQESELRNDLIEVIPEAGSITLQKTMTKNLMSQDWC